MGPGGVIRSCLRSLAMPHHRVSSGQGHLRAGWEQRLERSLPAPKLGLVWMGLGLALVLVLFDCMILWSPARAYPLPAQGHPFKSNAIVPLLQNAFGWQNLTCPACKVLFTALNYGLKVSGCGCGGMRGGGWEGGGGEGKENRYAPGSNIFPIE